MLFCKHLEAFCYNNIQLYLLIVCLIHCLSLLLCVPCIIGCNVGYFAAFLCRFFAACCIYRQAIITTFVECVPGGVSLYCVAWRDA